MRPFTIHIYILIVLSLLGVVLFAGEAFSPESTGGLIKKYTFTKLYWLAWVGYAVASTVIVLCVRGVYVLRRRVFTRTAVILSHVIPVGLLWIAIDLGIHDYIQDKINEGAQGARGNPSQFRNVPSAREKLPTAPLSEGKIHEYRDAGNTVQTEEQKDD